MLSFFVDSGNALHLALATVLEGAGAQLARDATVGSRLTPASSWWFGLTPTAVVSDPRMTEGWSGCKTRGGYLFVPLQALLGAVPEPVRPTLQETAFLEFILHGQQSPDAGDLDIEAYEACLATQRRYHAAAAMLQDALAVWLDDQASPLLAALAHDPTSVWLSHEAPLLQSAHASPFYLHRSAALHRFSAQDEAVRHLDRHWAQWAMAKTIHPALPLPLTPDHRDALKAWALHGNRGPLEALVHTREGLTPAQQAHIHQGAVQEAMPQLVFLVHQDVLTLEDLGRRLQGYLTLLHGGQHATLNLADALWQWSQVFLRDRLGPSLRPGSVGALDFSSDQKDQLIRGLRHPMTDSA